MNNSNYKSRSVISNKNQGLTFKEKLKLSGGKEIKKAYKNVILNNGFMKFELA